MKKWGFLLAIVVIISFVVATKAPNFLNKEDIQIYNQNGQLDYKASERKKKINITNEQVFQGNLLLVNNQYPVHQKYIKSDIVNLFNHKELTEGYGLLDNNIKLSKDIADKFSKMITSSNTEMTLHFSINSGYRDFDEQSRLYKEMGPDYALPAGHSEHNLGLSLDVGSTQMKMDKALEGKWIEKNAWKYGFILRYPKDKSDITGIQYEPWHIRYVGLPHSVIMHKKNFTLEEYLDYIKKEKSIFARMNEKKYTVSYYPISQSLKINVPENRNYEISGNNMDGVIVTVYE